MEIQVLRKGNQRNRLTVTMGRITLKVRDNVTEEQEEKLKRFALMVAQRTRSIFYKTMRGVFSVDLQSIEMQNTNRSQWSLYCIDELELEGFASDPIKSNNKTEESRRNTTFPTYSYRGGRAGSQYAHTPGGGMGGGFGGHDWSGYGDDFVD